MESRLSEGREEEEPFLPPFLPRSLPTITSFQTASAVLHNAGVAACCCCCSSRPTSNSNLVRTSSPSTHVINTSLHNPSNKGNNTDLNVISKGANGLSNHRKATNTLSLLSPSTSSLDKLPGHCNVARNVANLLFNSS